MPDTLRWFFASNQVTRVAFVVYDSTDHITPKTGLTGFTIKYTFGGPGGALIVWPGATITETAEGIYTLEGTMISATNDQSLMIKISATGGDPVFISGWISNWNPGDPVRMGLTALPNALPATSGGLLTSGSVEHTVLTNSSGQVVSSDVINKAGYGLSITALLAIADEVWNAAIGFYVTAGTAGKKLTDIVADHWGTAIPGAYGAGTAGNKVGTNIANLDAAVSSRPDATGVANSVLAALDNPNVELLAVPAQTSGLKAKINYLFSYFTLKRTVSTSTETVYAADNTTPTATSAISDAGGVVTKGKLT